MFLVDFERIEKKDISKKIPNEGNLSIFNALDSLSFKSERVAKNERFIPSSQIDLSLEIESLLQKKAIADCVGKRKKIFNYIYFSSIFKSPEPYHNSYFKIMKFLEQKRGVCDFIWLEDLFLFSSNYIEENHQNILQKYNEAVKEKGLECNIFISSEKINSVGIPYDFAQKYLKNVFVSDLLQTMPFHKRVLPEIQISDVLHFCWNLYQIYLFPGIYLAGINSKRNFEIFRKILKEDKMTILFLPIS